MRTTPRPDNCPGAMMLHTAADGPLARIRLPGGFATPHQLRALAECSQHLGNGIIEITRRANLQLRGITDPAGLHQQLRDAGLLPAPELDRTRNIIATSSRPNDYQPLADAAATLDAAWCATPELQAVPGKFWVGITDHAASWPTDLIWALQHPAPDSLGGCSPSNTRQPDIPATNGSAGTLLVEAKSGLRHGPTHLDHPGHPDQPANPNQPGHQLIVLACGWAWQQLDDPVAAVIAAAIAFSALPSVTSQHSWRATDLPVADVDAWRAAITDAVGKPPQPIGPIPEAGAERTAEVAQEPRPSAVPMPQRPPIGIAGSTAHVLPPLGQCSPRMLQALAEVAAEGASVQFTPWQSAITPLAKPDDNAGFHDAASKTAAHHNGAQQDIGQHHDVARLLAASGFITTPDHRLADVSACAGLGRCARAEVDNRAVASALDHTANIPVHVVACGRSCGTPYGPHRVVRADLLG